MKHAHKVTSWPVRPDSTSLRIATICDSVNLLFLMLSSFLDPEDSLFQWLNFRGLDQRRTISKNGHDQGQDRKLCELRTLIEN